MLTHGFFSDSNEITNAIQWHLKRISQRMKVDEVERRMLLVC